ncbi:phage tail domain-containing protein [Lactiplantibacillus pingfangensis]|uniref:phage tail domain-containing protein n=1 Tax=Lactiplantibacillus TaxID=2767842 RepID=UPI0010FA2600|nr:phage tail domain-containing protein [Lactiplantibacillus pingfangensis]
MSTILIQKMDGTTYDLDKLGIRVISFDPPGPNYQYTFTQMSEYRSVLTDTQMQQTSIPLVFKVVANDNYDYELMRMRVLKTFAGYEPFYVINTRISYLRWKVVPESYSYSRQSNFWGTQATTVNLTCIDGAAETVLTTLDKGFLNGFGMSANLINIPQYQFTNQSSFTVWNGSTIPLRAEEHPVLISIDCATSKSVSITNQTTNQTVTVTAPLTRGQPLMIYGLKMAVGSTSVYGKSNHAYLDFMPGNNQLSVSGISNFTISFKTHFYY